MIENGFTYAMDKYSEKMRKIEERKAKKSQKFYAICKKYNTDLPSMTKDMLTKTEYKYMVEYIEKVLF